MDNDNLNQMQSWISPPDIEIEDNINSYKMDHVSFLPEQNSSHTDNEMGLNDNSEVPEENSSHPDNEMGVDDTSVGPDNERPHSLSSHAYTASAQFYDNLFLMDQVKLVPVGESYVNIVASCIKDFAPDTQSVLTLVARELDSVKCHLQVAGSSNIVIYGQHASMENTMNLRQSQYASHLHGIVSAFQHGFIADIHLVSSNLWHITTSAFVLFNFDNNHYIKALQTALSNMDMHEKVAQYVLEYLQESIASPHKAVAPILTALAYSPVFALEPGLSVHNKRHSMRDITVSKILMYSFNNPIATKDRHLQAERAIWQCLTDMLLDQPWFLQLIQSLTDPALLTANSLIQWESKKLWPFLHKVYLELVSISTDGSSSNTRSDESINDINLINLTHEVDEDLPGLPEQATAMDLSCKVKWLKLQRVIQCNCGPLNTEHLVFKVPFPWECKQDMEIMNLLFPKAAVSKETVPNPISEQSTSPESPLSKLSNSTDESDSEDNEDGPKIEFNFYCAKCRPAALGNMEKLGHDDQYNGLPDVEFSDLKTVSDYEDFELDVQDLCGTLTWIKCLRGAKLWICAVPKNGYHLDGSIEDADPDDYDLIYFILEEDHYLTMDPGVVHFVLSLTDSVTQGGHFYNSEAFEKKDVASLK
ncbi:hypothetical protein M422DRAFT_265408 [Sphaerobolus stellatus SS14]|uniref:JmjC domain-containing protein n=1 Tax=Sphaerobolus stellatus (strain SS14) TaxID=990650 RepID=A0A0C9UU36_SPHS4|nr:hypothetical protein M422DRAFT_265408 [Sphaerobolus stellatus SS14]